MKSSVQSIALSLGILLAGCQTLPFNHSIPGQTFVSKYRTAKASRVIPGEMIVRLKPGTNPELFARQNGLKLSLNIGLNMYLFEGQQELKLLQNNLNVQWVEPNYRMSLPPTKSLEVSSQRKRKLQSMAKMSQVNDPLLPAQYGNFITGTDKVWSIQKGSPDVVVAVIDSGIDGTHPEFQGQLVPGWDVTKKIPGPGGTEDGYGHGTHVAGVIGAKQNNGIGISGMAPNCKLMPVRIFNNFGHSKSGYSAAAIIWAVDHGAKVINASWGSPMEGQSTKEALKYALENDVVFVAAVGNSANNDKKYPGASTGAIGVSATNDIDGWASFSTFGDWVSVAAPGEGILSTYPLKKGNGYRIMRGTSMAAPAVSAAAALIRSQFPSLNHLEVKQRLESTAKDVIMNGKDKYSGYGRIDVAKAILEPLK